MTWEQIFFNPSGTKVPEDVVTRKIGINPNISDANGNILKISGIISLLLLFGTYVIKMDLFVCERLE